MDLRVAELLAAPVEVLVEVREIGIGLRARVDAGDVSHKDAEAIIKKIHTLGSIHTQELLQAITPLRAIPRNGDYHVKYFIDLILQAISQHRKIQFQYTFIDTDGKKKPRRSGALYVVNPYALVYRDGFYYLICNYDGKENLSFYRIDRMQDLEISQQTIKSLSDLLGRQASQKLSEYVNHSQYNFAGEEIEVKLEIPTFMREEILDTYGQDVPFRLSEEPEKRYEIYIHVQDSPGLYYWLLQHADHVKVLSPASVRDELVARIKSMLALYE